MKAECKRCKNFEEVDAERAAKIQRIPEWSSRYLCSACYFGGADGAKASKDANTQDRIAYAQAWNLAVQMITDEMKATYPMTQINASLVEWQRYFYEKLTNRN
jgi:hypothetical protein